MTDTNEPRRVPAKRPGDANAAGRARQGNPSTPSMKERLLAQRRAAEAAAAAAARDGVTPPPRPGAAPRAHAPVSKGAARPAAQPVSKPPSKPVVRSGGTAGVKPSGATRAARARAGVEGDEGGVGRRRVAREPKPRSPIPMIATGLVLVVGAAGAYYYATLDPDTDSDTVSASEGPAAEGAAAGEGSGEAGTGDAPGDAAGDAAAGDGAAGGGAAGGGGDAGAGAAGAAAEPPAELNAEERDALAAAKGGLPSAKDPDSWNTIAITKNPNQVNDPNGVDLTKVQPYGKPPGVDEATWQEIVADAKAMFDPLSGAKGSRAEKRLAEVGLAAWPAITNEMLRLDPRRPDDISTGKRAEMLLDKIRGGTTGGGFNWRMPAVSGGELERKDLFYNLQLIVELHDVWRRHLAAPDRYFREKIAKGAVKDELSGKEPETAPADEEIDVNAIDLSEIGGG